MEVDMDLLLSVTGGLGRMEEMEDGSYAYVAADDCLGAPFPALQAQMDSQLSTPVVNHVK